MFRRIKTSFFLLLTLPILTGIGSCSPSLSQACHDRYPEFQRQFVIAQESLKPWIAEKDPERALASLSSKGQQAPLTEELSLKDRKSWQVWGEARLGEAQAYIDLADAEPELRASRAELSLVANHLVSFRAYAELGRVGAMLQMLKLIEEHSDKAHDLACNR